MRNDILEKCLVFIIMFAIGVGGVFPLNSKDTDVNKDGKIDVCDVQKLVSAITSNNIFSLPDINDDGTVDIKDLLILIKDVGKKQKTIEIKTDAINISCKTNCDNQIIRRVRDLHKLDKFILFTENKKGSIITKIDRFKDGDREDNYAFKPGGTKCIAYHLSSQSPPII